MRPWLLSLALLLLALPVLAADGDPIVGPDGKTASGGSSIRPYWLCDGKDSAATSCTTFDLLFGNTTGTIRYDAMILSIEGRRGVSGCTPQVSISVGNTPTAGGVGAVYPLTALPADGDCGTACEESAIVLFPQGYRYVYTTGTFVGCDPDGGNLSIVLSEGER